MSEENNERFKVISYWNFAIMIFTRSNELREKHVEKFTKEYNAWPKADRATCHGKQEEIIAAEAFESILNTWMNIGWEYIGETKFGYLFKNVDYKYTKKVEDPND